MEEAPAHHRGLSSLNRLSRERLAADPHAFVLVEVAESDQSVIGLLGPVVPRDVDPIKVGVTPTGGDLALKPNRVGAGALSQLQVGRRREAE